MCFPVFVVILVSLLVASTGAWAQQPAASSSSSNASQPAEPAQSAQTATGSQASQQVSPTASPGANTSEKENSGENGQPALKGPSLPPGIDAKTRVPLYETIQEDWSSLAIGMSKLDPEPAVQLEDYDGGAYTRELYRMKWRPGDPLDLYVVMPKDVKNPPAVLYLYGYKDDSDRFRDDRWCRNAVAQGYAAIGFVSALSGHRFHDRPLRQWFVSELQESIGSSVHDVKFILDYLEQRGDIDMKRIGMFGQSSGGTIAILAAAADHRIKAVDVLDPWGDWPVWLKDSWVVKQDPEHAQFSDPAFLKKVAPLDPVKWLPTLKKEKIRIQQVMDNDATPDECKDAIKNAAPKKAQIVRWDHAGQFMEASRGNSLLEWVKTQLKSLPASKSAARSNVAARATAPSVTSDSPKAR